jgi:hypothetical protein
LSNITDEELQRYKLTAKDLLSVTEKVLGAAIKSGRFKEITEVNHEKVSR